jgi:phosphoserine aminotransferase
MNVENFGVIYGGVQKNIGPAGMAIVIVREDLLNNARDDCPAMLNWTIMAENDSMYNTPPCYTMYMCGLVFEKLLAEGGLSAMEERNIEKSKLIYDTIAASGGFYVAPTDPKVQSCMNIPFTLANADLDKAFIAEAGEQGLVTLKGHRSVGGMRASVYNAMPKEGCEKLAAFMKEFQSKNQ